jgi:c-di-GMP-binding flagellar brake protein YcgR
MPQSAVLNIFQEPQPVTATAMAATGDRIQVHGVAQLTDLPYLKVQFPKSNIHEIEKVESGQLITVYFEIDHSVIILYTSLVKATNHGAFLLKIEDYAQKKQKRIATRVPAQDIKVEYRPVDEQGNPLRARKNMVEVINISKTGILLRMKEVIEPNQIIELSITLPDISLIACHGRVVRLALQKNGRIEMAVQFENVGESSQKPLERFCEGSKRQDSSRNSLKT